MNHHNPGYNARNFSCRTDTEETVLRNLSHDRNLEPISRSTRRDVVGNTENPKTSFSWNRPNRCWRRDANQIPSRKAVRFRLTVHGIKLFKLRSYVLLLLRILDSVRATSNNCFQWYIINTDFYLIKSPSEEWIGAKDLLPHTYMVHEHFFFMCRSPRPHISLHHCPTHVMTNTSSSCGIY